MVEKLPSVMIERPKMPRATWDALRSHIIRERLRKKQEHEQNQEFERQKMEREHKKKQEALTLEETKQQIQNFETKLTQLKEEKHQLFNVLKKVLLEDENSKRRKEVHQPGIQYLQPTARTPSGGGGHGAHAHGAHASTMYMKPHPQILMQGVSSGQALVSQQPTSATSAAQAAAIGSGIKRQRSPSPPRTCAAGQTISVGLPTSYYRNASGKYVTATTGSTVATSIYPTTVTGGSSTPGLATHYSSYPGGAVLSGTTTAGGQPPLSVATFASSSRPPSSSLSTVTDVRTQHLLSQAAAQVIHQTTGHPSVTLPSTTTVQIGGLGHRSSSGYVTSLAAASAAERDRQALQVNHAQAAAQAAVALQRQQSAAAAMQIAAVAVGQPPPAAHGGSQPSSGSSGSSSSFRAGSIMTGYPRYQQPPISTVGSGMASSNLSVNRSSALTAPASVRGSSVGSAGAPQSTQPSSNPPPGHGPPSSARFYQREV